MRSTAVIGLQMELEVARQRIEELEAENERLENLLAEGVHTCSNTCKRPLCVLRRENKKLSLDYISAVGQLQEALEKMEELERD